MKVISAIIHPDSPPIMNTRLFNEDKGHDLQYAAGLLIIRHKKEETAAVVPISHVAHMRVAEDELGQLSPKKR